MLQAEQNQNDPCAEVPQQNEPADRSTSPEQQLNTPPATSGKPTTSSVEKTISCVSCRRRKLKCDRTKPKCGTCSRLRHDCEYPERRRNLGSKRRNMKELEARLAQVETKLVSESNGSNPSAAHENGSKRIEQGWNDGAFPTASMDLGQDDGNDTLFSEGRSHRQDSTFSPHSSHAYSQDLVSLGMHEPLPSEDIQRELFQIYFDKVHSSVPMIHKYRFQAALKLGQNLRPPLCLQYAMWAVAASVSQKYGNFSEVFYERSRRYAEEAEMKVCKSPIPSLKIKQKQGQGEAFITVYHAQCWNLIATLEAKKTYFTRAWMSTGKCIRLVQMMGLYRLDQEGVEVRQIIGPPKDAVDLEERRRTFWAAYYGDRWASAGTGWPMTINEAEIFTNLPSSDESFAEGRLEPSIPLSDALTGDGASRLRSPFAGVILAATLFGHNFSHIHNKSKNENPEDLSNGAFWRRHRDMDNTLSNTFMHLPEKFRLPQGLRDLDVVFLNMNIHTSTICLHQAAVLAAAKHSLDPKFKWLSISRCLMAADEITTIMRLVSHNDAANMNSWMGFCLYVAGGVYVHDLRLGKPPSPNSASNLDFLLIAMKAIGKRHSITNHFTSQLEFDIDTAGLDVTCPTFRRETGIVCEASPNASSNGQRTAEGSPATFDDHETTQFSKSAYINEFIPANRGGLIMPPRPLSGIIQYEGEDCLLADNFHPQDYFEPISSNTSRFFISGQAPRFGLRERSANPASQSPSNIATDVPLHVMASLPKVGPNEGCPENGCPRDVDKNSAERPPQQEQAIPPKRNPWTNSNLANFGQDQVRSRTPSSSQPFGLIDRGLLAEQTQRAADSPDCTQPSSVSGVDFSSHVTQFPIRENHQRSPDYEIWNTQQMDAYNIDPGWNIDMVDTNMHDNFNLEGEGLRDFLANTGIAQWNHN